MHIAAYFIKENEFGIINQTVNFGGKYFYTFIENGNSKLVIEKVHNEKYIPNFYDDKTKLTQVSAIVGSNGAGKTSLIKSLAEHFALYYNKPLVNYVVLEIGETSLVFNSNMENVTTDFFTDKNYLNSDNDIKIQTIYYSPHLDFKDKIGNIDISLDNILNDDLENYNNLNHHKSWVKPIQQNKLNNLKRQLAMQEFKIINDELTNSFGLPKPENVMISFSGIADIFNENRTEFKFHNTPRKFQGILNKILEKHIVEQKIRRNGKKDWQKKFIKEFILIDIVSLLVYIMEMQNTYLEEGEFKESSYVEFDNLTALETFIYFIDNHYYITPRVYNQTQEKLAINPLPKEEIKAILYKLNNVIDKLNEGKFKIESELKQLNVDDRYISPSVSDITEIIELEMRLIEKLECYYQIATDKHERIRNIPPILNFEWYDRIPSSGENAIFNLFSKLYSIKKKIDESDANLFLLFLDEADAGFHPKWKKKYVDILTKVTPLLFEKQDIKFQIIFTTHDPFSLSDVLNYNIVYLGRKVKDKHQLFSVEDINKPSSSFAANITDLLSNSFFIGDGLIGDFSKNKIKETIEWLKNKKAKIDEDNYYEKFINNIDEPIVQRKLSEMYDEKMNTEIEAKILDEQIKTLQLKKQNLKKNDLHQPQ